MRCIALHCRFYTLIHTHIQKYIHICKHTQVRITHIHRCQRTYDYVRTQYKMCMYVYLYFLCPHARSRLAYTCAYNIYIYIYIYTYYSQVLRLHPFGRRVLSVLMGLCWSIRTRKHASIFPLPSYSHLQLLRSKQTSSWLNASYWSMTTYGTQWTLAMVCPS